MKSPLLDASIIRISPSDALSRERTFISKGLAADYLEILSQMFEFLLKNGNFITEFQHSVELGFQILT